MKELTFQNGDATDACSHSYIRYERHDGADAILVCEHCDDVHRQ